jgi:hypothetical protein
MDLMVIRDVMCVEGKGLVLTGPLLLRDVVQRSDVEWLLGKEVIVSSKNGRPINVFVKEVSVRQTMSGTLETSLGVEARGNGADILVDSVVTLAE